MCPIVLSETTYWFGFISFTIQLNLDLKSSDQNQGKWHLLFVLCFTRLLKLSHIRCCIWTSQPTKSDREAVVLILIFWGSKGSDYLRSHTTFRQRLVPGVSWLRTPCSLSNIKAIIKRNNFIEIIPSIFSDHNAVRLDLNYKRKTIKIPTYGGWTTRCWITNKSQKKSKKKSKFA